MLKTRILTLVTRVLNVLNKINMFTKVNTSKFINKGLIYKPLFWLVITPLILYIVLFIIINYKILFIKFSISIAKILLTLLNIVNITYNLITILLKLLIFLIKPLIAVVIYIKNILVLFSCYVYTLYNQLIDLFLLNKDTDFNSINDKLILEYNNNKNLFDSLQQPSNNLNYNEMLALDLNKNTNYSLNNHFPMYQSQVIITLTAWQYWWWMAFIFVITLFNRIIAKIFFSDNININPNTYTPLKSNGRWGDLFASLFPIFWCTNILINSNFILKLTENHTESGIFTLRVRGKQWYWVYKTSVNLYSDLVNRPVIIGRGNTISIQNENINLNNLIKTPYKSQFLNKIDSYNLNQTNLINNQYKLNNWIVSSEKTKLNKLKMQINLLYWKNYINTIKNINKFKVNFNGVKLNSLLTVKLFKTDIFLNKIKTDNVSNLVQLNSNQTSITPLKYNKNYYNTTTNKLSFFKTINFVESDNHNLFLVKYNENHWFKQYNRHFYTIQQQPVSVWNFNKNIVINSLVTDVTKPNLNSKYNVLRQTILSLQYKLNNSTLLNNFILKTLISKWPQVKTSNSTNIIYNKIFIKPVNEFFKKKTLSKNRLISCHNSLLLPTRTNITVITNSFDVVHSWFIPGLGIKFDCVPGRSTHYTFRVDKPGIYFGHCAEVCGRFHHHMPIKIIAVPMHQFIYFYNMYYPEIGNK